LGGIPGAPGGLKTALGFLFSVMKSSVNWVAQAFQPVAAQAEACGYKTFHGLRVGRRTMRSCYEKL